MYKELGEQELARYCREEDRMAEDELYRRYAARVYALCRRYIRNDDEAKDTMQEALVHALGRIQAFQYTSEGSLYRWLSRIAVNKAIDQIRKHRWKMVSLDFRENDTVPDPDGEEVETIPEEKLLEWIDRLPDSGSILTNKNQRYERKIRPFDLSDDVSNGMRRDYHHGFAGAGPAGGSQLYPSGREQGIRGVGLHADATNPVDDNPVH